MSSELTRRYPQPIPVSPATALYYRQFCNSTSVASSLGSIPESTDLLNIKADLEALLPISERRIRHLQKDLSHLRKNIQVRNLTDEEQHKLTHQALLPSQPTPPDREENKPQMDRQLALEALRRKRRREDDAKIAHEKSHVVKLKRLDDISTDTMKPTEDMVRVKQKDQVPITTFWSTMDPHFRPLTEEDCAFLMATEQDPKWYDIPPLGRHYTEVWSMENTESRSPHSLKYIHPLADRQLFRQDASCGLLTERVLSSLVKEPTSTINDEEEDQEDQEEDDEGEDEEEEEEEDDEEEENHASDKAEFEERLKQELHYIGLLTEEDIEWDFKEDDEICAELRMVARELKEQHSMNEYRKKKLLNIVGHQLQYEQYQHVLDSLDLQVEQCYIKRIRTQKSKKRKTPLSKSTLSEHAIYAMNKRKAWVDGLEGIFKEKNLIMPIESIYQQ